MQRNVEARLGRQSSSTGFKQKRQWRQFAAALLGFFLQAFAEIFHLGNVDVIPLGNVRDIQPVAGHILGGELFASAHLYRFNFTSLGEFHSRRSRSTTTPSTTGTASRSAAAIHHQVTPTP